MIVMAHKTKNIKNRYLHWEMMRETCQSFGAVLWDITNNDVPNGKIVSLRHDHGIPVSEYIWPKNNNIILMVGCDDSNQNDYLGFGEAIKIPTPVDYFLWSVVALGIVLYDYESKKN